MSGISHADVPNAYIDRVFEQMEDVNRHIYKLLTKRPERVRRYVRKRYGKAVAPEQIWLGTTIESGDNAWRADMLREVNAKTRFLSIEPMIGPVDAVNFSGIGW